MISSQLELHRLNTNRTPRVVTAERMLSQMLFRYQGHISAALVLGGVDCTGPHLYCIYPHGSSDHLQFTTMGSGSLAAMSVFESKWTPNMTVSFKVYKGFSLRQYCYLLLLFKFTGRGRQIIGCRCHTCWCVQRSWIG